MSNKLKEKYRYKLILGMKDSHYLKFIVNLKENTIKCERMLTMIVQRGY